MRDVFPFVEQINYAAQFSLEEQKLFNIQDCHLGISPETTWNDEIYLCKKLKSGQDNLTDFYKKEVEAIRASKSYRIGRFFTYIPRKIRDMIKNVK